MRGAIAATLCCSAIASSAAELPRAENVRPIAPGRYGGPLYVVGELQRDRPELIEGRLRLSVATDGLPLGTVATDPLVVPGGGRRFRQLLPVQATATGGIAELRTEFVTDDEARILAQVPVRLASLFERNGVILAADALGREAIDAGLASALRLEAAFRDPRDVRVRTFQPTLPASEFPEDPLSYCAFDVVVLSGNGFLGMTPRRLAAVSDWTRAGGAVLIAADRPVQSVHAEFVNGLFRDGGLPPFVRDDRGRLLPPGGAEGVSIGRAGLGVAVVLTRPLGDGVFETPAWRVAHARLWRLRNDLVPLRWEGGLIDADAFSRGRFQQAQFYEVGTATGMTAVGTAAVELLRPADVRTLPGGLVLLILAGYAAAIGPVDYLLLGAIRRRKWTWLLFPLVTVAVTWGTIATADAYLSATDARPSVELIDLDAAGVPVRRTRLELLFRGRSGPVARDCRRELFAGLDSSHFSALSQYGEYDRRANAVGPGVLTGSVPARYEVLRQVEQWTPQIDRTFEIAPEIEIPPIDWATLERGGVSHVTLPGGVAEVLRTSLGREGLPGDTLTWESASMNEDYRYSQSGRQLIGGAGTLLHHLLLAATRPASGDSFAACSPLGGGRLDDLTLAETPDVRRATLVVVRRADGLTVYRKPVVTAEDR